MKSKMVVLILLALLISGYTVTTPQPSQAKAACTKDLYVITAPLIHPAFKAIQIGAEQAAKDLGVDMIWLTPAEYDVQKQVEYTESAISLPCVKGISVNAADPTTLEASVKRAQAAGITVVQQASCSDQISASACWSTDFVEAGGTVAERVAKLLNGKGKVVIAFGAPGNSPDVGRQEGFEKYLAKNAPDVKVVGVVKDCDSPDGSVTCAENALSTYPDMNAYYSLGFNQGVGASQVFLKANRKDIILTAVDDDDTVVNGIKKGTISFTYVQQFYGNGYLQVYIPWLIVNKGLKPATKFLPTPIVLVDKSNIDSYKDVVIKDFDKLKKYVDTEYMKK